MKSMKKRETATIWRVFCRLGDGRVSGNCGHAHPTPALALRCMYEPAAYRRDPEAELLARPVKKRATLVASECAAKRERHPRGRAA